MAYTGIEAISHRLGLMSTYLKPKQARAAASEKAFLNALSELLQTHSYNHLTVAMITDKAGLSHGAFMGRFGSKRSAVSRLFTLYCDDVYESIDTLDGTFPITTSMGQVFLEASSRFETVLKKHWGVNKAMHELFLMEGKIDPQTKGIFKATVDFF